MNKDAMRLDANETAFFKRQIEFVKARTYDVKYRNLRAKQFIPVSSEASPGADYIIWYSYSKVGIAKIIASYASDFPRVDIYGTENQSKVYSIGASYGYSIQEIRRAQMAGVNLNARRAETARQAIEEQQDKLAWNGNSTYNIAGFINYSGITEYTVPNGAASAKTFASKTPDEIIKDFTGMMNAVAVPTRGRESVTQFILPRTQYNDIKNRRLTEGGDKTVLMYLLTNNPELSIDPVDELAGAGASSTDRMMAYVKDPSHLTMEIPQPFEQFEADKQGMEYVIPCHARYGGVIVYYPASVVFGDGI